MSPSPANFTIEYAEAADIPVMIDVDRKASTLFEPTGLLDREALNMHVPSKVFESALKGKHVYVARDGSGQAIGFTLTSFRGNGLYLDQISVDPVHGQRGIGRALMMNILRDAEARHCPDVTLSTFRDLPWNGPFYTSLGFKEIPRSKYEPFMVEIETTQKEIMDTSHRCFMRRKVRRSLFRLLRSA